MAYGHDAIQGAQRALNMGANPKAKLGGRTATLQALIHGQTEVAELILSIYPQSSAECAHALLSAPDVPDFALTPAIALLARTACIEQWATPSMLWLALSRSADAAALMLLQALASVRASTVCAPFPHPPWAAIALAMGNPCSAQLLMAREAEHHDGPDWLGRHAGALCLCALSSSRMPHLGSIAALPDAMRWLSSPHALLSLNDFETMHAWTLGLPKGDFSGTIPAFDPDPAFDAALFECSAPNPDGAQGSFIRLGAPASIVLQGSILCEDRIFRASCPSSPRTFDQQHHHTKRL
jgi:hypothetical protein